MVGARAFGGVPRRRRDVSLKALLFGGAGMLAHDLRATAPDGVRLQSLTRADLDVTDGDALQERVGNERPQVILNAAAFTDVDAAEFEPARTRAFRVNAAALTTIGAAAAEIGATVVHFSTDYVFDGEATRPYTEEDTPNPVNAYGRSKLEGEQALRVSGAAHLILRSQWLFGVHGRSFPLAMWRRARRGERTRVVADQFGRPTSSRAIAEAVWLLVESGVSGTIHVANSGAATWYEVARRIFTTAGRPELVAPCTTAEYGAAARRPRAAVLDTGQFERVSKPLPAWEESLDEFLASLARC